MKGNRGINLLAQVISGRIAEQTRGSDELELGTIRPDAGLLLDRFPVPIPKGSYLVGRRLTEPETLSPLQAGDRVLVAWVNGGTDPVIVDVVVST